MTYFGFALADGMFARVGACKIQRTPLTPEAAKAMVQAGVTPCLNPSHAATISAMRSRYGIDMSIPERPPVVNLGLGDQVIVMGVRGLPRLTDRHEYTKEEIASANFAFTVYEVLAE